MEKNFAFFKRTEKNGMFRMEKNAVPNPGSHFCSFTHKNERFTQKTKELIPNPSPHQGGLILKLGLKSVCANWVHIIQVQNHNFQFFLSIGKWALNLISFTNFFHIFEFPAAGDVILLLPEPPPHHSFEVNLWGIDSRS